MSTKDQVRLPDGVAPVTEEMEFDSSLDVAPDPSGRRYDDAYLDELADEAERSGPSPSPRASRPSTGPSLRGERGGCR